MEVASDPPHVELADDEDWRRLRADRGIRTVVDPMVFRTAELFFRGQSRAMGPDGDLDASAVWTAIESNLDSLVTFVDCVVLNDRLPMFDYGVTFPDYDAQITLRNVCNRDREPGDELLVPVTVRGGAWEGPHNKALATLAGQNPIHKAVRDEIVGQLAAYEWDWQLTGPSASREDSPADRRLEAFRYGGLLFSGYAQRLHGEHVIQPKRARLYLEGALAAVSPLKKEVEGVFAELVRLARALPDGLVRALELPRLPTFLPYLLRDEGVNEPMDLLDRLLKLRDEREVRAYRDWWSKVLASLAEGIFPRELEQELHELEAMLEAQLQQPVLGGCVGAVATVSVKEGTDQSGIAAAGLALPGEGDHRKVLFDLLLADREVFGPEKRLEKLWKVES